MQIILAVYTLVGLLLIGLALPLAQRCVRLSPLYSFRVTKTPNKTRSWHNTNAYAGRRLRRTGIAIVLMTLGPWFLPGAPRGRLCDRLRDGGARQSIHRAVLLSMRYLNPLRNCPIIRRRTCMTPAHSIRSWFVRVLRNRVVILASLICAAYILSAHTARAFPGYLDNIPNGRALETAGLFFVGGYGAGCGVCHGGTLAMKADFGNPAVGNHSWTLALANADSDSDGFTNGEELQDPNHTWTTGAIGTLSFVSNPSDVNSTPPAPQVTDIGGYSTPASGNVAFNVSLSSPLPVAQVVYTVRNAGNNVVHTYTSSVAPYNSDTWDTTAVPDGNYTVTAVVTESRKKVGVLGRTGSRNEAVVVSNAPPPPSATRYVATSGSDSANNCTASAAPCATIQRAVDQANDTDEVRVATGVYTSTATEVVNVGTKAITLTGGFTTSNWTTANPAANPTTIDGENARQGVVTNFSSALFTIQGFTIRNGNANRGAGIDSGRNNATIRNNRFENNNADQNGGGVYLQGSDGVISNNVFLNNHVTAASNKFSGGGGLEISSGPNSTITGNLFDGNTVSNGSGGGIYLVAGSSATLTNNTFVNNQATFDGGGLYSQVGVFTLTNALFANNQGSRGAAISSEFVDRATITYATIAGSGVVTEALSFENTGFAAAGSKAVTLTNTLISGYGTGVRFNGNPTGNSLGLVYRNVLMANDGANAVATETNNVSGSPTITGTPIRAAAGYVGGGNYHLATGAFAIDKGVATPGITTDLDGDTRPIGSAPDIGMDEFVPIPAVPPTVSISATDASAAEQNQDVGVFTVTRSGDTSASLTVNYSVTGSAAANNDYATLPGSVTISPGHNSATITVTPFDDGLIESPETVVVTLSVNAAYTVGSPNNATVTIADNDNPIQTVIIVAPDLFAAEHGQDPATFTITRNGSTASALTVKYIASGTATPGSDYNTLSQSVIIPAGQASANITITPVDDTAFESAETVILTLTADAAYIIGSPNTQTITIADNDGTYIYLPLVTK
jgi:parallel beta-helix repeat protein